MKKIQLAWSMVWYAWWKIMAPVWHLPLRFGWNPTVEQYAAWGAVLGLRFAIHQSVLAVYYFADIRRENEKSGVSGMVR